MATQLILNGKPIPAAELVTGREAGDILRVDYRTLARWANAGKITNVLTPGGTHRYLRSEIEAIARGEYEGAAA